MDPQKLAQAIMAKSPNLSPDAAMKLALAITGQAGTAPPTRREVAEPIVAAGAQVPGFNEGFIDGMFPDLKEQKSPRQMRFETAQQVVSAIPRPYSDGFIDGAYREPEPPTVPYAEQVRRARVQRYEQLKTAREYGYQLTPDEEAWIEQVDSGQPMVQVPQGRTGGRPIGWFDDEMKKARGETPGTTPAPRHYPMDATIPDRSSPPVTPEEAARYGLKVDPPTTDWGVGEYNGPIDGLVINGRVSKPGRQVLEDIPREAILGENGLPAYRAPESQANVRSGAMTMTDAIERAIGPTYLGNDPYINKVMEQSFGSLTDIYEKDGKWPDGFFDGMTANDRKNIERGVEALRTIRSPRKT